MCGIVGMVSSNQFSTLDVIAALKRLEYRGYDSVGIATSDGWVSKDVGEIDKFMDILEDRSANLAISHTRWATHGRVTKENAHPHASNDGSIIVVHNGIIENFEQMRAALRSKGYSFISQTDTEIIANYLEDKLRSGMGMQKAIRSFMKDAEGTFAILIIIKGEDTLYAAKRDSPLVLGILGDGFVLASDIYAFSDKTSKSIFFDDNEYAVITPRSYTFYVDSKEIEKQITEVQWTGISEKDEKYEHYMIKEIHEQPVAARRLIESMDTTQRSKMDLLARLCRQCKRVLFVAAGTSYHASLAGVYMFNSIGIEAHTLIASEFQNFMLVNEDALVIAISQSGETMDVVKAIKYAKDKGSKIVSIVNVPYSTVQRLSEVSVEILAGQEICVASTKTYTNQVLILICLANLLGFRTDIKSIPEMIGSTIESSEEKVMELSRSMSDTRDIYVIGRGISYPLSREVALKLKEISYIHAEGMMGGELKHGTIALIEEGTIVFSFIPNTDYEMLSNTQEVAARGAHVIMISDNPEFEPTFLLPPSVPGSFSVTATIIGQLFAYYIAKEKGLPIDKPRNLAKSVTVK
ncbi:MAG: glutamine--fructose-6-phosphate transaminase (isomerizing) [Candidatus Methanofastidiosa archaeon]|nr:glutamine--fructose-6-phosphate transaminase (isomerizing) [Candidatus Methanofastidiosa archaeon]